MSMHDLWTAIGQLLMDAGRGQEMCVFLDWIFIASVCSAVQVPPMVQLAAPPTTLLANTRLLGYLGSVVQRWLPGLAMGTQALPQAPQLQAGGPQVAGMLQQVLDDQHVCQQAKDDSQVEMGAITIWFSPKISLCSLLHWRRCSIR